MKPGQILLGKYRIERELGTGGMGIVVQAEHLHLGTPLVIKCLRAEYVQRPRLVKRFLREAKAAARLRSEHICRVFDVGSLPGGAPYMAMEFMRGVDLRETLGTRGKLARGLTVDYMLQACEALAEAHAAGIVHRDLKPGNLFLARQPDGTSIVKVLDFGISKVQSRADEDITLDRSVLGTPAYMSPEQMRSARDADARSDIWSLGVVLFELLNGYRPFRSKLFTELCIQVSLEPLPPMDASIPQALQRVIDRCLRKKPDERYQNVAELVAELAPFAADTKDAEAITQRASRLLGMASGTISTASARAVAAAVDSPGHQDRAPSADAASKWASRSSTPSIEVAFSDPDRSDSQAPVTTISGGSGEFDVRPAHARNALWVVGLAVTAIVVIAIAVLSTGGSGDESETDMAPLNPALTTPATQPLVDAGMPDAAVAPTGRTNPNSQKKSSKGRAKTRRNKRSKKSSKRRERKSRPATGKSAGEGEGKESRGYKWDSR